jgi:hypothetical protein
MRAPVLIPIGVASLLGACTQPALRPSFVNGTPEERTMAAMDAVRDDDTSKVSQLITMLDSQDPAQRMIASDALFRLTGQTNGYNYADPEAVRSEAVARWRRWYLDQHGAGAGTES